MSRKGLKKGLKHKSDEKWLRKLEGLSLEKRRHGGPSCSDNFLTEVCSQMGVGLYSLVASNRSKRKQPQVVSGKV